MSRLDCLREAILEHMNDPIRRKVVPSRFQDVMPEGTTLRGLVDEFVRKADSRNAIEQVCTELKQDNPAPRFEKLLDQCLGRNNPFCTGRPRWYDNRLPLAKPLIGRDGLREGLYETLEANPDNPRVMTVRGDAPGKTYCRCLVQHVAEELGFAPPVLINLFDAESVDRLALLMVDKLGLSHADLKERFSTEVREGKYFNDWLIGRGSELARRGRIVFVFDHLAKEGIPQDVTNTVLDLAQRVLARELDNVWIILLDCPVTDALEEEDLPFEEEVQPIPKASITDFLEWLRGVLTKPGEAPPDLSQDITNLLDQPFPLSKKQLKDLRKAITRWMRSHRR